MKNVIAGCCVIACASVVVAGQSALTDETINAAILQGRAGKTLQKTCTSRVTNGFDIVAEGPTGRIMRAARDAKRQHRDFSLVDVTPAMLEPVVTVSAKRVAALSAAHDAVPLVTSQPVQAWILPPQYAERSNLLGLDRYVTDFVVRSKRAQSGSPVVLRPIAAILYDDERAGMRTHIVPGASMAAAFDLRMFESLPAGDVEVVVFMTDTGEQRCRISEKERRSIR
jgi:hypothetical protein